MRHSQTYGTVTAKLARVIATIDNPKKTHQGQIGQRTYMYADLEGTYSCCIEALEKESLLLNHSTDIEDGQPVLETRITDLDTEEWVAAVMLLPEPANMQAYGSSITYARRYTLHCLLRMLGEDDDDGAADAAKPKQQTVAKKSFEEVINREVRELVNSLNVAGHPDAVAEADMQIRMALGQLGVPEGKLDATYGADRELQTQVYKAITALINEARGL